MILKKIVLLCLSVLSMFTTAIGRYELDTSPVVNDVPLEVHCAIDEFKERILRCSMPEAERKKCYFASSQPSTLMLHGPEGNGKHFIAERIAKETDSVFLKAGIGDFLHVFEQAKHYAKAKKSVVICLEDPCADLLPNGIKRIGGKIAAEIHELHSSYNADYDRIMVVYVTDTFEKFGGDFRRKFYLNIRPIDNPTLKKRQEFIAYFFKQRNRELAPTVIDILARNTDSFSVQSLKALVDNAVNGNGNDPLAGAQVWRELAKIKKVYDRKNESWKHYFLANILLPACIWALASCAWDELYDACLKNKRIEKNDEQTAETDDKKSTQEHIMRTGRRRILKVAGACILAYAAYKAGAWFVSDQRKLYKALPALA